MLVALYARVSTVRQAEADLSIPDQLNQMRAWCRANGHDIAKEYVEPGASATDDRQPVFQRLIDDATTKPHPYEAVIVFARSRFFRDMYGTLHYERMLEKAGARLISITQPTTDDGTGQMLRHLISMMDAYSSQENAKHTSSAMLANARLGFFNGSRAPFGYQVVDTDVTGHKGKVRKRLAVDETEAQVVRKIYQLYQNGLQGRPMGVKAIAEHLTERGVLMRGHPWRMQKISDLLSDPTYRGDYCYNMRDSRNKVLRPESEWVRCAVEPIIDEKTFDAVRLLRAARDPKMDGVQASKNAMLPTLLTGLIKCEHCGTSMTLATGKGGQYKYYKCYKNYKCYKKLCITRKVCKTPNLPMERMDRLVLERLVDKVLTPERVTVMLREWLARLAKSQGAAEVESVRLTKVLRAADEGLANLYKAIEKGAIVLDSTLQVRVTQLRDQREKALTDIALLKRDRPSPRKISPKQVAYACSRMRAMLLDAGAGYGKQLLTLLVNDIRVTPEAVTLRGSKGALNQTVSAMTLGTPFAVPSVVPDWRARQESNL